MQKKMRLLVVAIRKKREQRRRSMSVAGRDRRLLL